MNAMKSKIKSQRGASITFALLLFLVCAIISSIVVVAATAVGGRASQMAELDQRYYAVNSAAELLRDELEKYEVMVTTGSKKVWREDQDGISVDGTTTINAVPAKISLDNYPESLSDSTNYLILGAAVQLVREKLNEEINRSNGEKKKEKEEEIKSLPEVATLAEMELTVTGTAVPADKLKCSIKPVSVSNGKLDIRVSNADATKGTYTLRLTFKADVVQSTNEHTKTYDFKPVIEDDKIAEGKYTQKKEVDKNTFTTIKWKLIDLAIDTFVAPAATTAPGGGS